MAHVALVVGATGIIGGNLVSHLSTSMDWQVVGLSRAGGQSAGNVRRIAVDLQNEADCRSKLGQSSDITHIFYAGFVPADTWAAHVAPNLALLRNVIDAVEPVAGSLAHVCLMQGTKYYGAHLGPYRTPAREDDPRHMPPNFYYDQQDFLMARQAGKSWRWSALRPHAVLGLAQANPMNILNVVATYAAISKELGLPLRFPGTAGHYRASYQMTDAQLLAKAAVWAATDPRCGNQAINITNGDVIRWEAFWPKIAAAFGMQAGDRQEIDLQAFMADKAELWRHMVQRHGLKPRDFASTANWAFGNYAFAMEYNHMSDTNKCRRLGFLEFVDTEQRFLDLLAMLRRERYVP
jgi:nucleoside-diphosphate-sugar epimerase